jgi:UDP-N-acetylglucosamine acyltransferase
MDRERPRQASGQAAVHPSALVDPGARLGSGVVVGPYAVVEAGAVIGAGTSIGAHCVIKSDVSVGEGNRLSVGVVLGEEPQHRAFVGERSFVRIGHRNIFREYVTVNRAYGEGEATEIGDDNYLMSYVHIGHNCRIATGAILTSGTKLAGHVLVEDRANLGGQVGVHQFVRFGRLVMVGGGSIVRQDVPPFVLAFGMPARAYGLNSIGLSRAGVPPVHRTMLKRAFMLLYRSGLAVKTALARVEAEVGDDAYVRELVTFIRASQRGIIRWAHEHDEE